MKSHRLWPNASAAWSINAFCFRVARSLIVSLLPPGFRMIAIRLRKIPFKYNATPVPHCAANGIRVFLPEHIAKVSTGFERLCRPKPRRSPGRATSAKEFALLRRIVRSTLILRTHLEPPVFRALGHARESLPTSVRLAGPRRCPATPPVCRPETPLPAIGGRPWPRRSSAVWTAAGQCAVRGGKHCLA